MKKNIQYDITNIVASIDINEKLNLDKLKANFKNAKYNPDVYFALIYKLHTPKLSILVNWSGKLIFTGAKKISDIENARKIFFEDIKRLGYTPKNNVININNIVVKIDFNSPLKLEKIFEININQNIEFEKEIFPGLILKHEDPKFTALIFKSGKVIMTGLKELETIKIAIEILENKILIN